MSTSNDTTTTDTTTLPALQALRGALEKGAILPWLTAGCTPEALIHVSRYLSDGYRREVELAERAIADALPALTEADYVKACNGDSTIVSEVETWKNQRWSWVDVSDLRGTGDDDEDGETWAIVVAGARFEVREVPRYEARRVGGAGEVEGWIVWNNEINEQADDSDAGNPYAGSVDAYNEEQARAVAAWLLAEGIGRDDTVWIVIDTNTPDDTTSTGYADARDGGRYDSFADSDDYDPEDEDSANEAAAAANARDYRENAAGWPFAQNYAAAIDAREADDFAACGFVVAEHTPSGQHYAGIDGGGYSFLDAHWAPLFLRYHLHGRYAPDVIYVRTRDGLRRVVRDGAK